jgi:hypothetical protein
MEDIKFSPYAEYNTNFTAPTGSLTPDNQHFFNVQNYTMSLGTIASWTKKYRVYLGEAMCDASTVISTVSYALRRQYNSGRFAVATGTAYPKIHNLGTRNYIAEIKATTYAGGPLQAPVFYYNGTAVVGLTLTTHRRNSIKVWSAIPPSVYNEAGGGTLTAVEAEITAKGNF